MAQHGGGVQEGLRGVARERGHARHALPHLPHHTGALPRLRRAAYIAHCTIQRAKEETASAAGEKRMYTPERPGVPTSALTANRPNQNKGSCDCSIVLTCVQKA